MLLISGTDTDAGKTVVTASLLAYARKYLPQQAWTVSKPIQCGQGDREYYASLLGDNPSLAQINPIYLDAPLAPPIAAAKAGVAIDLAIAWQSLQQLQSQFDRVLIEAAGGLGTPMTAELTVADLAREWRLPTILVAPVRLGSIGSIVANAALARQSGVDLRGIVLNCDRATTTAEIADLTPPDLISSLTRIPVLGIVPHITNLQDLDLLANAAGELELLDSILAGLDRSKKSF
jgi:dethiobiotin synthetase